MNNPTMLVSKICESGFTVDKLAELLEINTEVFREKIENPGCSFTIRESQELVQILRLKGEEAAKIFFD